VVTGMETLAESGFKIYPNPMKDLLYIDDLNGETWNLINIYGQEILSGIKGQINVENLSTGIYILRIGKDWIKIEKE